MASRRTAARQSSTVTASAAALESRPALAEAPASQEQEPPSSQVPLVALSPAAKEKARKRARGAEPSQVVAPPVEVVDADAKEDGDLFLAPEEVQEGKEDERDWLKDRRMRERTTRPYPESWMITTDSVRDLEVVDEHERRVIASCAVAPTGALKRVVWERDALKLMGRGGSAASELLERVQARSAFVLNSLAGIDKEPMSDYVRQTLDDVITGVLYDWKRDVEYVAGFERTLLLGENEFGASTALSPDTRDEIKKSRREQSMRRQLAADVAASVRSSSGRRFGGRWRSRGAGRQAFVGSDRSDSAPAFAASTPYRGRQFFRGARGRARGGPHH